MSITKQISAVIITLNEEGKLEDCLKSLDFVDEIVVVDSGSKDKTIIIAKKYGARIISQSWLGFGKQKQFAVDNAKHDWVLCIDADERVSPVLQNSIVNAVNNDNNQSAFNMPRRNKFMGKWLKHGEGYPDYNLRLFKKHYATWSDDAVHEHVIAINDSDLFDVGILIGDLMHESEDGIGDYLIKQNRYTTIQAESLFNRGKRFGFLRLVFSPCVRFIKFYVVRRGFLDGIPGFVHVTIGCINSFTKYAKTIELQKRNHESS